MSDFEDLPSEDSTLDQGRSRMRKSPTAFRTISEVADELHVPQHVLRFWETKFPQVKPLKRGGGRRYYRPDDLALLRRISELLYIQGYTIKGVQRLLREGQGRPDEDAATPSEIGEALDDMLGDEDLDPSQGSDEESLHMLGEDAAAATPCSEPTPSPHELEAERLRTVLRDALASLEALRATLG